MKRIILSLALALLTLVPALADSPLTSTSWWDYYENKAIVNEARELGCTDDVLACLANQKAPIDLRLALVNALSWNFNGQSNYDLLVEYIATTKGVGALKKVSPETQCVMAYLRAMDDYFDVTEAHKMAERAHKAKPKSRAIAMIYGLISAQEAMDSDWGMVYTNVAKYANNKSLKRDMSDYAVEKIMEYINLYKPSDGPEW